MKYVLIDPRKRSKIGLDLPTFNDAIVNAGLKPGEVDHGMLSPRLAYVVFQFANFVPVTEQSYFSIGRTLICGPAVLYLIDDAGETIDLRLSAVPDVTFYLGANDVEAHITVGDLDRPVIAVNGEVLWKWPEPRPDLIAVAERMAKP